MYVWENVRVGALFKSEGFMQKYNASFIKPHYDINLNKMILV